MAHLVSPSLLSADFSRLGEEIIKVNSSEADWLHLDIMDGRFVPNISFGFPVIEVANKISSRPLDIHLMIVEPEKYLSRFTGAGAHVLTVHYEACTNLNRTVNQIRELGARPGVSINPHTPVSNLKYILPFVDLVLLMTVNPGYGGQKFITNSFEKIAELKSMIAEGGHDVLIEVDGGVDTANARQLVEAGVDVLVAGSSVFGSPDPVLTISKLKNLR
jgi:ribulose-phosphate 3-epimerase